MPDFAHRQLKKKPDVDLSYFENDSDVFLENDFEDDA